MIKLTSARGNRWLLHPGVIAQVYPMGQRAFEATGNSTHVELCDGRKLYVLQTLEEIEEMLAANGSPITNALPPADVKILTVEETGRS